MAPVRGLVHSFGAACVLTALAACGSVPSYYSDRVAGSGRLEATAQTNVEPGEPAPRRRLKRPTQMTAVHKQSEPAPVGTSPTSQQAEPDNTGSANPAPSRLAPAPQDNEAELARMAARERAISRTLTTICRGC